MDKSGRKLQIIRELSELFFNLLIEPRDDQRTERQAVAMPKNDDQKMGKSRRKKAERRRKLKDSLESKEKVKIHGNSQTFCHMRKRARTGSHSEDIMGTPLNEPPEGEHIDQLKIDRDSLDAVNLREALRMRNADWRVDALDLSELDRRLGTSISSLTKCDATSNITDLVLGLDIGSTSTKSVIRLPYFGAGAAQPVPAPGFAQADGHPYYWRTILWEAIDGKFSLSPEDDAAEYTTIKVDVIADDIIAEDREAAEVRFTAYAALMMRQSFGWFVECYPKQAERRNFIISINVGFPSAAMEHNGTQQRFRDCCRTAGILALSEQPVTRKSVSEHLAKLRESDEKSKSEPLVEVYPELSGAISGFIHSSASRTGTYVLVDVGGLTLDCIFFSLRKDEVDPHYAVYAADICRYGSQVVEYWLSQGNDQQRAIAVLGSFYAKTVISAHKKLGQRVPSRGINIPASVPTLMIGGGRSSEAHRRAPGWATKSIKNSVYAVSLSVEDLAPPLVDLDAPKLGAHEADRLLVACGLSLPRADIPQWKRSEDVPDAEPLVVKDYTDSFVGPEQT